MFMIIMPIIPITSALIVLYAFFFCLIFDIKTINLTVWRGRLHSPTIS